MVVKYALYYFNLFELNEICFMVQSLSRSTLINALCVLENNVYSAAAGCSVLEMSFRSREGAVQLFSVYCISVYC